MQGLRTIANKQDEWAKKEADSKAQEESIREYVKTL